MKKSFFASFSLFTLLAINIATPAFGGRISTKKPTPAPTPPPTLISSVTGNAITISDGTTTKTFTITQFTEIYVNGQKGTIADLKPGMVVSVAMGTSPTHASRINASGAPPAKGKKQK